MVAIAAGAKQRSGESRTDLLSRNLKILRSAINDMKPFREDAVLLLVANPVDVLTYFAQQMSGLPKSQVIGSGTFLDSTRLRGILARHVSVVRAASTRLFLASMVTVNLLHGPRSVWEVCRCSMHSLRKTPTLTVNPWQQRLETRQPVLFRLKVPLPSVSVLSRQVFARVYCMTRTRFDLSVTGTKNLVVV